MKPETQPFELLRTRPRISSIRVGWIVEIRAGRIRVDFPGNPCGATPARRTASVTSAALQRALESQKGVLLAFQDNDPALPIIFDIEESEAPAEPSRSSARRPPARAPRRARKVPAPGLAVPQIARIVAVREGVLFIDYDGNSAGPVAARTTVALRNLKDEVLFVVPPGGGPVVVGQIYPAAVVQAAAADNAEVRLKADRIVIEADTELSLVAGGCEIHLDARGKMTSTADQVVSRARSTNKLQGGSVQIN